MSSVQDFYLSGAGQERSERYSVPLDGSHLPIGPFPFRPRSIVLVNQTTQNLIAQDDRGEQYIAAQSVGATYGMGDTMRLEAWLDAAPSPVQGKASIVVSDQPAGISAAQLSSFAALGQTSGGGVFIDKSLAVVNLTGLAEQTIYQATIPGSRVKSDSIFNCKIGGDVLHNNLTGDAMRLRVYLDAVVILDTGAGINGPFASGGVGAARQPYKLDFDLWMLGALNAQQIERLIIDIPGFATPAPATGEGGFNAGLFGGVWAGDPNAVDMSVDRVLKVTGAWSVASANDSFRKRIASLEVQ